MKYPRNPSHGIQEFLLNNSPGQYNRERILWRHFIAQIRVAENEGTKNEDGILKVTLHDQ